MSEDYTLKIIYGCKMSDNDRVSIVKDLEKLGVRVVSKDKINE